MAIDPTESSSNEPDAKVGPAASGNRETSNDYYYDDAYGYEQFDPEMKDEDEDHPVEDR
ncbi:MAG: hypothetical protein AB7F88_15630 [Pyrinomonadaceae bacterium]